MADIAKDIAVINGHIARVQKLIADQQGGIDGLRAQGEETSDAELVLRAYNASLRVFEDERRALLGTSQGD